MGLAQTTARMLRDQGHDAVHLRDESLQTLPDEAIVAKALAESRVIVTQDLDFGRIVALSGQLLPSVVTFRVADARPVMVNELLRRVVDQCEQGLSDGALVTVTDRSIRVRLLPV